MILLPTRRAALAGLGAATLAPLSPAFPALAQTAARPVRLVLGAPGGAAPDVAARIVAERLSALWGVPVVVDNRPAANGNLAGQAVAAAAPDGATLLFAHASLLVLNERLMRNTGFDSERDFVPISGVMAAPFLIATRPGAPYATLPDLLAAARARPGTLTFATSGAANLPRFAFELMRRAAGVDMTNVPYAAIGGAVSDTITGRADVMIEGTPVLAPQVRSGAMRALAVTSAARFPDLPAVPTVAETHPDVVSVGWFGVLGPRGTPPAVSERIARDLRTVLTEPDLRARLARDFAAEVTAEGPDAFAAFVARERATYGALAREVGVRLDG